MAGLAAFGHIDLVWLFRRDAVNASAFESRMDALCREIGARGRADAAALNVAISS